MSRQRSVNPNFTCAVSLGYSSGGRAVVDRAGRGMRAGGVDQQLREGALRVGVVGILRLDASWSLSWSVVTCWWLFGQLSVTSG